MMKFLPLLLVLILATPPPAQAVGSAVIREEFQSETLRRAYRYNLYLPAGYTDSDRRYPVIYLLHGRGDDLDAWLTIRDTSTR